MRDKCGGAANLKTPILKVKRCFECDTDVEIFSTDIGTKCGKCGFILYNEIESCIQWCKYAKECVGEELYKKLKKQD